MERSTEDISVTIADFKQLLISSPTLQNNTLSLADVAKHLYQEAQQSIIEKESFILWLLADISDIKLSNSGKETFEPRYTISKDTRTMVPADLTSSNIEFLQSIFEEIPNVMLKARVADILWDLHIKPKNPQYAEFVIDIYINLPFFDHDTFFYNQVFIKRGLRLARNMNKENVIHGFEKKVLTNFVNYQYDGYAYLANLCDFMIENQLCETDANTISEKLFSFGKNSEEDKNFYLANKYYSRASVWANKYDKNKAIEYQCYNAKASIHHAEYVAANENQGLSENHFYEEALKIVRALPKEKRRNYISEKEELDILDKIRSSGQKCLDNMKQFSAPIDLSECINQIESHIKGKSKEEALEYLALVSTNINYEGLKESAIKMFQGSPLFSMISKQFFGNDGRVIAHTNGYDITKPLTEDDKNVQQWMVFEYQNHIQMHVVGIILPALHIFVNEHTFTFRELNDIVNKSTIFPNDRKGIITKGLMAGFEYDFITALHLLIPQVENMVRYQLRLANVKTSGIDKEGIETENGLSTLVKNPEFDLIFGKDLGFEIKALLCDPFGTNLRNNVAHGLLDMEQMQSQAVIYFWWFCLRLVYIEYWNSYRKE